MTRKAVCATHERAYDVDRGCDYCEPKRDEATAKTAQQSIDEWLKSYTDAFDAFGAYRS